MSDNTTLPGTGDVIASDDIGGVKFQRVKTTFGADGVATDVSTSSPLPVAANDCVSLLSTTISATGNSASIDTLGYGAVVVQLSGGWSGGNTFESSNDGTTWDTILVFSRDSLNLQDIVTQNGLFTIRPSGRYLRMVTSALAGTISVNAIGRSAEGISAADVLSMAMDRNNNTPMHVQVDDQTIAAVRPQQPMTQLAFYDVTGVVPINTLPVGMGVDVSMYKAISFQYSVGTTGVATPQWSNDGTVWATATTYDVTGNTGTTLATGTGLRFTDVLAKFFRIQITTATTAGNTRVNIMGLQSPITNMPTTQAVSGTITANIGTGSVAAGTNAIGDVGIQYRASATGGATIKHIISAASTNATNAKASAGRVVGWSFVNTTASLQYVKLHNTAGTPTAGAGVVQTIAIPANGVNQYEIPGGIGYATGIAYTIVTGSADADATATTAGAVVGDLFYA